VDTGSGPKSIENAEVLRPLPRFLLLPRTDRLNAGCNWFGGIVGK